MIGMIQNLISNPTIYNATQNTITQVTTETSLKAVGRPSFILADKKIDSQTKKFSALKEFLYQLTCLGIYLAIVTPIFQKGSFKLARKIFKDEPVLKAFKKPSEFKKYFEMSDADKAQKLKELSTNGVTFTRENINENFAKGVIEGSNIIGSVSGLAILAPIVSHPLIHPILSKLNNKQTAEKKIKF